MPYEVFRTVPGIELVLSILTDLVVVAVIVVSTCGMGP